MREETRSCNQPLRLPSCLMQLAADDLSDMGFHPKPWAFEVEDDCEFVPYFDEDQVQRRLDEVPEDKTVRGDWVGGN